MKKIGLKLWSPNKNYFAEAKSLIERGLIDYIELTAVTSTFDSYASLWRSLPIPYIIHAPTFSHGISLSQKEKEKDNIRLMQEVFRFADYLNAPLIIIHPGGEGQIEETIRQIKLLNDPRLCIENKPYKMSTGHQSNGYLPEEIKAIKEQCNSKFCFDFCHAVCTANSLHKEHYPFLHQFLALKPDIYHFMDGGLKDTVDEHLHLGEGDYDLKKMASLISPNSLVTIETRKDSEEHLRDFEADISYFSTL